MIDLHCHVLPALDDGARDLEDSVGMALQAQADGIATICATPHIRHDHAVTVGEIAGRVAALQATLTQRGIAVRVVPGGELAETELDTLDDEALRAVSLGGAGGWVLLEPAPGPLGAGLVESVRRLAARGLRAVIAHPERHAGDDFEAWLAELARHGCLIQWTAAFVAHPQLGDVALTLARRGLLHLLGSDAHSSRAGRPVRLSEGFARLATVLPPETIAWMSRTAPEEILRGEAVVSPA